MCLIALVLALLLPSGTVEPGADAQSLTLDDALQTALKGHPSLARAAYQTGAARARVRQAGAGMMPNIAIQGAATDGPAGAPAFGLQGLSGDPLKKHFGSGINLVQPVYDFGRTDHLVAARRLQVGAALEDEDTQKAAVLLGVQSAYFNVLRSQQLVTVQQDNVRQREETVRQAQLFVDAGLKADVDLQLARANLADAQVALAAAQNDVNAAFAALNNAMGETKLQTYRLAPVGTDPALLLDSPPPPPAEDLMRQAVEQRPELQGARLQVQAADQSIRAARSDLMPRIDTISSLGALTPSKLIPENKPYAVGIAATIPIFTGGAVEGRVTEEKQRREAAVEAQRELEETVKLQVARAWLNVQTRTQQLRAAQEQVTAANASLTQATERYRLQLSTFVELLTAQTVATRAQAQFVDATYDLDVAKAELDWATGTTQRKYPTPRRGH